MDSQAAQLQEAKIAVPTPCGLSHIAIPSRDLNQSKQFFVDVLGGTLTVDAPALARFDLASSVSFSPPAGRGDTGACGVSPLRFHGGTRRFHGHQAAFGSLRRSDA